MSKRLFLLSIIGVLVLGGCSSFDSEEISDQLVYSYRGDGPMDYFCPDARFNGFDFNFSTGGGFVIRSQEEYDELISDKPYGPEELDALIFNQSFDPWDRASESALYKGAKSFNVSPNFIYMNYCRNLVLPEINFSKNSLVGYQFTYGCNLVNKKLKISKGGSTKTVSIEFTTKSKGLCEWIVSDHAWYLVSKIPEDYVVAMSLNQQWGGSF